MNMNLDPEICYTALKSRDARFDGKFFTAVRTTGIYCRPICPAITPQKQNCTFYTSAAAAQEAGFRPCLRCRPEVAPGMALQPGISATVNRALRLIADGALDESSVTHLADRLGVEDRHLRRLFSRYLGASPITVAQTRRIHFAKQLLDETKLPITEIAFAAGFGSIRRFNDAMLQTYQRSPRDLRRDKQDHEFSPGTGITIKLPFAQPYDWPALVRFLSARTTAGIESISEAGYSRTIELAGQQGLVQVKPVAGQRYLLATIYFPEVKLLANIVERLRRLFDLNANILEITTHLQTDPVLRPLVESQPGLRVPGAWDEFELAVRAILGQQVSVQAATTLAGRLVERFGTPLSETMAELSGPLLATFPRPEVLAQADLTQIGLPQARAAAISALAQKVAAQPAFFQSFQTLEDAVEQLCQLPGIGPWTASYIAMRALGEPDAFPASDLGIKHALEQLDPDFDPKKVTERAEIWRPWRAYATMYLWNPKDDKVTD